MIVPSAIIFGRTMVTCDLLAVDLNYTITFYSNEP
jgi:hypothetical protein